MSSTDVIVTQSDVTITPGVVIYLPSNSSFPSDSVFLTANLLSELNTDYKKTVARTNLGLQNVDGGTFE